ncbi:MAG TPA: PEGA domain-containing protein [Kofleriaceae bacterium]
MRSALTSFLLAAALVVAPVTSMADPGETAEVAPDSAIHQKLAVWRFDALGIEPELVTRLESLFRAELARLARQPMPSPHDIDRAITGDARDCTGEERCLAAIGKKLGVEIIVTGTVGQLGDNYVLTIKAVDVAGGKTLQKIQSDPLRGQPDELIEGVRVAAYRLLAPAQLLGALQIQTDLVGAAVELDGQALGKTPLASNGVIGKLALGKHHLKVVSPAYAQPYEDDIEVRFQKVSPVVVRLVPSTEVIGTGKIERIERQPFYTHTWFIIAAGVVAVGLGAGIGYRIGHVAPCHTAGGVSSC